MPALMNGDIYDAKRAHYFVARLPEENVRKEMARFVDDLWESLMQAVAEHRNPTLGGTHPPCAKSQFPDPALVSGQLFLLYIAAEPYLTR